MIIYTASCNVCGDELDVVKCYLDNDSDLCITIGPCEGCLDVARADGKEAGKEEANA